MPTETEVTDMPGVPQGASSTGSDSELENLSEQQLKAELEFIATGTYSDGSTQNLTTSVTWSSSNLQVATVGSSNPGVATGISSGTANIYAMLSSINGYASITVEAGTPTISSLSATSGTVGSMIAISGQYFTSGQPSATVTFNGISAAILSWSDSLIMTQVPVGATSGPVQVNLAGLSSNTSTFTVTTAGQPAPMVLSLSETFGAVGDTVIITGIGFGTSGTVSFNGTLAPANSWSTDAIVTQIPAEAQSGPVTVTSSGQTSNGLGITIIATPVIAAISPASGDAGTTVMISGNNFGTLPNGPIVLFNDSAIAPTSWTNSQIAITIPKGIQTGPLVVRVASVSSNATTFTIVPAGSHVLSIFPATATLAMGQTLNLSLYNDLEHNITGASWSLSDNTIAQLSTSDPPVLTAELAGTETVTATLNGLTATAQITISPGGVTLPLGTVVCALPATTSAYTVLKIMQMVPSSGSTPDLVAVEDDGAGSIWLRGMSSGCEQDWHTRIGSSPSGSGVDFVNGETPDNLGGVIVLVSNTGATSFATESLIRVDGTSGNITWRYDSSGSIVNQNPPAAVAIDQNGYILTVEDSQLSFGPPPDALSSPIGYSQANLIKIDPNSGSKIASWAVPSSTYSFAADGCGFLPLQGTSWTYNLAGATGQISVGPDGTYYLEVQWLNNLSWNVPVTYNNPSGNCVLSDTFNTAYTQTASTQLMTVSPSGGVSFTDLPGSPTTSGTNNNNSGPGMGLVIPDGNGGALATTSSVYSGQQPTTQVTDFGGSAGSTTISDIAATDMVLGDQGTYFTTDGNQIVDVNEASGNELWSWQPESGTVEIIAATTGGGVAIKNIVGNQEDVVRLDSNGNPTYDTWGTTGGPSAYGVVSNATFVGETELVTNLWIGDTPGSAITGETGEPLIHAPGDWSFGAGNGSGDQQGQSQSSGCGDTLDGLIKEYSNENYLADFTPDCDTFISSKVMYPTLNFTFQQLDVSDIKRNEYPDWAIFRPSLLAGLESIRAGLGGEPLTIDSAYRSPDVQNIIDSAAIAKAEAQGKTPLPKPSPHSRHIHGDAVDILTGNNQHIWQEFHDVARALYPQACIEPHESSTYDHLHIDWRPLDACTNKDWLQ
jgi:hypothetical protein